MKPDGVFALIMLAGLILVMATVLAVFLLALR